ncbi:MAG: hypothetical protein K2I75_03980 [Clostridiales bacterium]|nr:hypothetical protein [Clostridiales bacterium]
MKSFKQVITDANAEYIYSTDIAALDGALASIEELLLAPALNDNNRANAEALGMRLACKIFALKALQPDFSPSLADKLNAYVEQNLPIAKDKGYVKSAAAMENVVKFVTLFSKYAQAKKEISAQASSENILALNGKEIIKNATELIDELLNGEVASPFEEGVVFPALSGEIAEGLQSWKAGLCGAYAKALERTVSAKLLTNRDCDYFPTPECDEGGKANALILNTPFIDEARLYAANAVSRDTEIYEFNVHACGGSRDSIDKIFSYAEYKKCAVFIYNADMISDDDRTYLLRAAMLAGKAGTRTFISDVLGGALYDDGMTAAVQYEDLSALDISQSYITMPSFDATADELVALKMADDGTARAALREMPFLGFAGLNEIVRPEHHNNWMTRGKKISAGNTDAAKRYLARIKASMLFIDDGWGEFRGGGQNASVGGEFDYDGIPAIDIDNVKRIVESNATVFGKCGMIARYCTTGTDDYSVWSRLDREQMQSRAAFAVKLVYRVLGVPIDPIVEIEDEPENDTAGGLCYDGGKRIVFKYSCATDVSWMRDAIVHESFHALQAMLMSGHWAPWYYEHMGITYGRACKWRETREQAYDGNTRSKIYKVHIYEADAYAFEIDCRRGLDEYWNGIDFE